MSLPATSRTRTVFFTSIFLLLLSVEWSRSWHFILEKMNLKLHYTSFLPICRINHLKWTLVLILPCTSLLPSTCLSLPCATTISCSTRCRGSLPSTGQATGSPCSRLHPQGLVYHKACTAGPASGSADNTVHTHHGFSFSRELFVVSLLCSAPGFHETFVSSCLWGSFPLLNMPVWHMLFRSYEWREGTKAISLKFSSQKKWRQYMINEKTLVT